MRSRFKCNFLQTECKVLGALSTLPLMRDGQSQPQLGSGCQACFEYGTMPEMIERLSGQRIVSVTASLHGIPLGEAQKRIAAALKKFCLRLQGAQLSRSEGQIPALEETISGLRTGLLLSRCCNLPAPYAANFSVSPASSRHTLDSSRCSLRREVIMLLFHRDHAQSSNPSMGANRYGRRRHFGSKFDSPGSAMQRAARAYR